MSSFYEEIGGEAFFTDLVSQFYAQVALDPILRPMYPEGDLKAAALRLQWFLEQYWGGPTTYQENRGHPVFACAMQSFILISQHMMLG